MERTLRCAIALAGAGMMVLLVCTGSAHAQASRAIPETALRTPWEQHLAILQSVSVPISSARGEEGRKRLADALSASELALGGYETQVDQVIDRLVSDPQYAYAAEDTSRALALRLGEVHARLDVLYDVLRMRERDDVRAAQASLETLRDALARKIPFERDVARALGSGSRQEIVGLATCWWNGEERAIAVKKLLAEYRETVMATAEDKSD
jgi:hypothetical protein